MVKNYKDTIT